MFKFETLHGLKLSHFLFPVFEMAKFRSNCSKFAWSLWWNKSFIVPIYISVLNVLRVRENNYHNICFHIKKINHLHTDYWKHIIKENWFIFIKYVSGELMQHNTRSAWVNLLVTGYHLLVNVRLPNSCVYWTRTKSQ